MFLAQFLSLSTSGLVWLGGSYPHVRVVLGENQAQVAYRYVETAPLILQNFFTKIRTAIASYIDA